MTTIGAGDVCGGRASGPLQAPRRTRAGQVGIGLNHQTAANTAGLLGVSDG